MKEFKYTGYYNRNNEGFEFKYNVDLDAESKVRFVSQMTNLLVSEHYNGIIYDLLFNFVMVSEFTDLDLSEVYKANNVVAMMESFFNDCDIVDQLMNVIDEDLIHELKDAISKDVEYKTGIRMNSFEDNISMLIKEITKQISKADLNTLLSGIMSNMNPDKVVEAYMKSDIFKKRNEEIIKAKNKTTRTRKSKLEVVQ